jgi:hypothetical protein
MPAAVVAAAIAAAYAANRSAKVRRENPSVFNVIYPIDDTR